MRSSTSPAALAAVLGALFLSACGGGGGGSGSGSQGLSDAELERLRSDPRIMRLGEIGGRADTASVPSLRIAYSLSAGEHTEEDSTVETFTCAAATCQGDAGTTFEVGDPTDSSNDGPPTRVELGSRGGFDTMAVTDRLIIPVDVSDATLTRLPPATVYGLWGQHGWAGVEIANGPMAGRSQGVDFAGTLRVGTAVAFGDATGSNPTGSGRATWTGIAEAASTDTFQRHQGIATLTIADLSRPRVDVGIDIGGDSIGSPAWSDMALTDGRFEAGTVGTDRIQGDFYGPDHEETYGTFDTGAYVGAFGAKRD